MLFCYSLFCFFVCCCFYFKLVRIYMSTAVKYYAFLYVIMFPEFALFLLIILLFGDEF